MPKSAYTCAACGAIFHRWPSAMAGKENPCCSNACVGKAKTAGLVATKRRRGASLKCEACGNEFYRKPYHVKKGRSRFCSEPCRMKGYELHLIDRSGPRPQNLKGRHISCRFCGKSVYRKKSMIERNIDKTCGKPACVSAYSRSLWGLDPRSPELVAQPRAIRKARRTNFTAKQRKEWLDDECKHCGKTTNLTLDHIVPVCAGGESTRKNAQTLCGPCNNIKAKTTDRDLARRNTP